MAMLEFEVVIMLRGGHVYTYRLLSFVPAVTEAHAGWEAGKDRLWWVAELRLDVCVAGLLGLAGGICAALRIVDAVGAVTARCEVIVAEVGACVLDLVYDALEVFEPM